LIETSVTVELPDEPAFTDAGVVAVTEKSPVLGTEYFARNASGVGVAAPHDAQAVWKTSVPDAAAVGKSVEKVFPVT
jgi:hypothetical protein